jgi:hypothetical protein
VPANGLKVSTAVSGDWNGGFNLCPRIHSRMQTMTVSDPPTQAQVQAIAEKLDETLTFLRRV